MNSLPARLTDSQYQTVKQIAQYAPPEIEYPTDEQISACLARIDAVTQRREQDDAKGALRFAEYLKELRTWPKGRLMFATDRAIKKCTFFPTIAELIRHGSEWRAPIDRLRNRALAMMDAEFIARRRNFASKLKFERVSDEEIASWPDWLRQGLAFERLLIEKSGVFTQNTTHIEQFEQFKKEQEEKDVEPRV